MRRAAGRDEGAAIDAEAGAEIEDDEDRKRVAKGVVVEGADRLGHEERQEALRPQKRQLALAHAAILPSRSRSGV